MGWRATNLCRSSMEECHKALQLCSTERRVHNLPVALVVLAYVHKHIFRVKLSQIMTIRKKGSASTYPPSKRFHPQ